MVIPRRLAIATCLATASTAALAEQAAGPAGSWVVEAIGVTRMGASPRVDITFAAEGRASGSSGCNRFTGAFTREGASGLRFGPVAGTRMACEEAIMAQEQRFHQALELVRGWRMDGPTLLLTGEDGAVLLRLARAAP
ncbi:META domain-containing protein [Roseomonas terrae]|jgi:heat shock protein HslJ|uniref:META domain-containing protein n=1 Tax=Neoroseomonas terrae TaxID=424799 RepID=A0ABS5EJB5_9PROT|nr:META domain-containing protein [Neoroseomonas terrae]MBR0651115.1 META domain-containing protein [Neoroseomonas terrae]